jgi:hypothetical protein
LEEEGNPNHRIRVEYNKHTLLMHLSDEDGRGWTTVAVDRSSREWAIAQRGRQLEAADAAYQLLYSSEPEPKRTVARDRAKKRRD